MVLTDCGILCLDQVSLKTVEFIPKNGAQIKFICPNNLQIYFKDFKKKFNLTVKSKDEIDQWVEAFKS